MRIHTKLRAFQLADTLVVSVYTATKDFPKEEMFGLTSQMRRAAVSIPSNIVEGCAMNTEKEYLRFLDVAYGSSRELDYQVSLARKLGFLPDEDFRNLKAKSEETCKVMNGLIRSFRL